MTAQNPASTTWRGVDGGEIDHLYVGAWVLDQETGERSQIEALLSDGLVQLRRESGESIRVRLRRGDPNTARGQLPAD